MEWDILKYENPKVGSAFVSRMVVVIPIRNKMLIPVLSDILQSWIESFP